jgi:Cft2 family RNA processing exonuclease
VELVADYVDVVSHCEKYDFSCHWGHRKLFESCRVMAAVEKTVQLGHGEARTSGRRRVGKMVS